LQLKCSINILGRGGGSYGFRRQNDSGEVEILNDAIFIQNLPKNITREDILAAFSTVGNIKVN
jgi:RNA recognition motif-containing protein